MRIIFNNKVSEKQFSSRYKNKWKYPKIVSIKLQSIENFITSARSLADIAAYSPYHFHKLVGDRDGEWAIYVGNTGYRVTLIPCDDDGNELVSGDIMAQCKMIKIVMVTGVSNHYE